MKKLLDCCFVGSTNPVKLQAVKLATSIKYPQLKIYGLEVKSGVPEQPRSDAQTRRGAVNRSRVVLKLGLKTYPQASLKNCLGVGLEGGIFIKKNGEMWSTVWVAIADSQGKIFEANGARFKVPKILAKPIAAGEEMGPALSRLFNGADIRRTNGAIGVVTGNFVTRPEEYAGIAKLAFGLWFGQGWDRDILTN